MLFGDAHIGHKSTDEELLKKTVERIASKEIAGAIDMGDACEFVSMQDKRFDIGELAGWIEVPDIANLSMVQVARYAKLLEPVRGKLLTRLNGNHEDTIRRRYSHDVYNDINDRLDIPDERRLGYCGFLRLRCVRNVKGTPANTYTLDMFLDHGFGGGRHAGAKANNLEKLPMGYGADIYAMGHTHTALVLPAQRRIELTTGKGTKLRERIMYKIGVPSFKRGEEELYLQKSGGNLQPQALGHVEIWIWPDKRELRVFV